MASSTSGRGKQATDRGTIGVKGSRYVEDTSCLKCHAWRGQLGLEPDFRMYVAHMVEVCRAVRRVLKRTGSMYIVLGDTYYTARGTCFNPGGGGRSLQSYRRRPEAVQPPSSPNRLRQEGLRPKCLVGIPWRVALALIDDGWILRNDIIWYKPNHMPESVKDRLTKAYEHVFHFVKARRYYYNLDAIREPHRDWSRAGSITRHGRPRVRLSDPREHPMRNYPLGKNPGDVFQARKEPYRGNNPHRMRLQKQKYLALDPSRPMDLSHPKGKNPGDVFSSISIELLKDFCLKEYEKRHKKRVAYKHKKGIETPNSFKSASEWNRGTRETMNEIIDSLNISDDIKSKLRSWWHDRQGHPKGKNPGDVLGIDVLKKLTTEDICRLYGYEPNAVCPVCGRTYKRHVSRAVDRGVIKSHRIFIPCKLEGKNPGSLWSISTKPFPEAHFAVYPLSLTVKPILSSCPPDGVVLDPFVGSGTTCLACELINRQLWNELGYMPNETAKRTRWNLKWIGIELVAEYVSLAKKRLKPYITQRTLT